MRALVASVFCILLVPGLVTGQSSSDTAQVAAALAADFQQMDYAVHVVGGGIGAEVAAVLDQETAPEGLRPDCPSGSGGSQSGGVAVQVRLTGISKTEAGVEVVMRCQSDNFLGGYYGVIEYGFQLVGGQWTIVAKRIVVES